jgi:hypothetical protein
MAMQEGKKFFLGPSVANFGAPVEQKVMHWGAVEYDTLVRNPSAT